MAEETAGAAGTWAGDDLSWDPAVGITYEVAEAVVGDLISYASVELDAAQQAPSPDPGEIARRGALLTQYVMERRGLSLDAEKLHEVIEVRGAELGGLTGLRRGGANG